MTACSDNRILNFPDAPKEKFNVYRSDHLSIIRTSFVTYEECTCSEYHFLVPIHNAPTIILDKKIHKLETDSIFACNPGQRHRMMKVGNTDFEAFVLYLDKSLLQTVSESMFGSSKLELQNIYSELTPNMKHIMNTFIKESSDSQPGSELLLQSLSIHAAVNLLREGRHNLSLRSLDIQEYSNKKNMKKAIEYLKENYNQRITLEDLAHEMNYSPYHFLRIFKSNTGITPFEYLLNIKIDNAKTLLKHTNYSITQVCDLCGFSSNSYFTQAFKRKVGVVPSQYKIET